MEHTYWQTQDSSKLLYPDIEWSKPVRKDQSGRLGIIGGNKLGFSGVAEAYQTARSCGAGDVRVLLPDALKKTIPSVITETLFASSTPSGSLAQGALPELSALSKWSSGILLAGDAGRNSETAIVYEKFINEYSGPLTITRDAVDLVKNNAHLLVERDKTIVVASFAQIQKLFQAVYYPKILTFSMQLMQLVEALHKFTITYPLAVVTLHQDKLIIAHSGNVVTQNWDSPMRIWRGETAAKISTYWLWNPSMPLESAATAVATE